MGKIRTKAKYCIPWFMQRHSSINHSFYPATFDSCVSNLEFQFIWSATKQGTCREFVITRCALPFNETHGKEEILYRVSGGHGGIGLLNRTDWQRVRSLTLRGIVTGIRLLEKDEKDLYKDCAKALRVTEKCTLCVCMYTSVWWF